MSKIPLSEYSSIHSWIRNKFGSAKICENPNCKGLSTKKEWALRKGCEYSRDINCFIQLCKRCHIEYDNHCPEKLYSLRDKDCMERINKAKCKQVQQFSLSGELIKVWGSAKEAGIALSISNKIISQSIIRDQNYKGYKWRLI